MVGACPGSAGEVQLTYYPLSKPENKIEKEWIPVDENKNFTNTMETGKS